MEIEVQFAGAPLAEQISPPLNLGAHGVWLEFRGVVRGEENSQAIAALEYEAYAEMAERQIRRLLEGINARHPCLMAKVIHRVGIVPVGETAIYLGVAAKHRAEAIALVGEFMDGLKKDVPIWKRRALPVQSSDPHFAVQGESTRAKNAHIMRSLAEARTDINSRCHPLPPVRVPLEQAFDRVLRETVLAPEDLPMNDRSTRDGYAILQDDAG